MANDIGFQGSSMTLTREAGGPPIVVGNVFNVSETANPANKINIGSWEDTIIKTRPGRPEYSDWTFGLNLNPDDAAQVALEACKISGETCTFVLVGSEGTLKTKTFHGQVDNFGFTGQQNDIYKGTLSIAGTDLQMRS